MYDDVVVKEIGKQQYLISQDKTYPFRVAVLDDVVYVSLRDLAECCGYQCPAKVAQLSKMDKVKIRTRAGKGTGNSNRSFEMWYITLRDSLDFVADHSMNIGFAKWYENYSKELEKLGKTERRTVLSAASAAVTPAVPANFAGKGVNILPEQIDKLIVDLLALKQSLLAH